MSNKALLAFGLMATLACEQVPTVIDTQIAFQLPQNDRDAETELSKLVIEAWPASLEVCAQFADWRQVVCNKDCPDDIDLARRVGHRTPKYRAQFKKLKSGWNFEPLVLGEIQNIQITIRGYDTNGIGIVYGCRSLELGERTIVSLSRPWCDPKVCLERFHPSCAPHLSIECGQQGSFTSSVSTGPVCQTSTAAVRAWEQMGTACSFVPASASSRCRTAKIKCEEGAFTWPNYLESDGICPQEGEKACKTETVTIADDLNCDGILPIQGSTAMGCACQPGTSTTCQTTEDTACDATAFCQANHSYGDCTLIPRMVDELCNGRDDNCNEIKDELDPGAHADCQSQRNGDLPSASKCGAGAKNPMPFVMTDGAETACLCGVRPACDKRGSACCKSSGDYTCVDSRYNETHCGACDNACGRSESCCDSGCFNTETSTVHCGTCGNDCRAGNACCNEECKDIAFDSENCGACGNSCAGTANGQCCDGQCTSIANDMNNCGRCGTKCDGIGDRCFRGHCFCGDRHLDCASQPGTTCCPSAGNCIDLQTDDRHCGMCGLQCGSSESCMSGRCIRSSLPNVSRDAGSNSRVVSFDGGGILGGGP